MVTRRTFMRTVAAAGATPVLRALDALGRAAGPATAGCGLSWVLNPMSIPVYESQADVSASLRALTEFQRTPLRTCYLCRDYAGQTEPY